MTWVQTYTGKRFDLLNPKVEDICTADICFSLSKQCRFFGHTSEFYSVAEHSYRVMKIVGEEAKSWALLHDATEAYIGDISRPMRRSLKAVSGFDWVKSIEDEISECIREKYLKLKDYDEKIAADVKNADNIMLATEARDLLIGGPRDHWTDGFKPLKKRIIPMTSEDSLEFFVSYGVELGLWKLSELNIWK
jgi:uncharacterized protein